MDVHPPQGSIRTWKDFLVHLLTITIGLFIALTLEAAVESLHHRHLVRDGRTNLDREISANQRLYGENVERLRGNRDQLRSDIAQLRDLRDGKPVENSRLSWRWEWNSYSGTAWTTARDSGAVSYMSPEVISSYSWIYLQQDYINSTALKIFDEETKAGAALEIAGDPKSLTRAQIDALLLKTAELDLSFEQLQITMTSLSEMYAQEIQHRP
jgi:hypothetical protein